MWTLKYTKQAQKDALKLAAANLKGQAQQLLDILAVNPYQSPPSFEKLKGTSEPTFSRRINIQHRSVYQVIDDQRIVKVLRMWTYHGD
ncbi:Txe/YoeB family addiction module toxin [Acaryochloris sp. IP29b_bin.148]|uniref:Txe/YoeB family addiction module toxin n=1 Tax=Acaryochloris sp. IP29b_bin.148 TaxID=2969218 RepID=UPI00262B1FBB|nr:Txe/YoeB family addiction module toxin [Acaryochloris sp. IP29b_bin.148]